MHWSDLALFFSLFFVFVCVCHGFYIGVWTEDEWNSMPLESRFLWIGGLLAF